MKTKLPLLLLFFVLFLFKCDLKADPGHKSPLEYRWVNHPLDFYLNVTVDSTTTPHSLLFETMYEKKGIASFLLPIYQLEKNSLTFEIKIRYKTENCENLFLAITSVGDCENINSIDTIQLNATQDWKECTRILKTKKAYFLNISVGAVGYGQRKGKIWISDLEVLGDGKAIGDNPQQEYKKEDIHLKATDLIHWNNKEYDNLPFLNKKILGLGETTHGTETMNDIGIEISKERILKHQCRFILLEIPLEFSLYINRYVQNDKNFKFEYISERFEPYLFSDSILSFIRWIKEYNSAHNQKISILGFDLNTTPLLSRADLFNFFYNLKSGGHVEEIDTICESLLDSKTSFEKIISKFDKSIRLADCLDKGELKLIHRCLEITGRSSSSYFRFVERDRYMNDIVTFIIDHFLNTNETVTLFGHLGHLNYKGNRVELMDYFSLGYYLKSRYVNNYSCIGLITNRGTAMLPVSATNGGVTKLEQASQGSLEFQVNKLKMDSGYLSMSKFTCSDVFLLRELGSGFSQNKKIIPNQFQYMIPKSRMEGVIFTKESVNFMKGKEFFKKNMNVEVVTMRFYIKALEKLTQKKIDLNI